MTIPIEYARKIINRYHTSRFLNLFTQADARSILQEVRENADNFPDFDPNLVDRVTMSAYSILSAGVSLAENEQWAESVGVIRQAADLLANLYAHDVNSSITDEFHVLIAAMAFYTAREYSRAFVCIRNIEAKNDLAKIIIAYIKKLPDKVIQYTNPYLLANLISIDAYADICEHAVTVSVSRSMSHLLEYYAMGDEHNLQSAKKILDHAMELASTYQSPSLWWIVRLLRLMILQNGYSSFWKNLLPYFPNNQDHLEDYIRLLLFGKKVAFELEQTLSQTFDWLGFQISHLYGGSRVGIADKHLAEDASIIIATPEKAKAILRGTPELFNDIKLIIVDEGHLIGENERHVKNELFLDHIRSIAKTLKCRIIVLSAVLSNPEDLALWLTNDAARQCIPKISSDYSDSSQIEWGVNFY